MLKVSCCGENEKQKQKIRFTFWRNRKRLKYANWLLLYCWKWKQKEGRTTQTRIKMTSLEAWKPSSLPKCLEIVKVFISLLHVYCVTCPQVHLGPDFFYWKSSLICTSLDHMPKYIFCELQVEKGLCQEYDWVGFNWTFFSFETEEMEKLQKS